jgi:hypothetical protein
MQPLPSLPPLTPAPEQALEYALKYNPNEFMLAALLAGAYHALHRIPEAIKLREQILDRMNQTVHFTGRNAVMWWVGRVFFVVVV